MKISEKRNRAFRRSRRVRAKIRGTASIPRLSVFRSVKHLSAQLIDDDAGRTLLGVSEIALKGSKGTKSERARQLGELFGQKAKTMGVVRVVFDRGSSLYHGRIAVFAEAVRAQGVKF